LAQKFLLEEVANTGSNQQNAEYDVNKDYCQKESHAGLVGKVFFSPGSLFHHSSEQSQADKSQGHKYQPNATDHEIQYRQGRQPARTLPTRFNAHGELL